MKKLFLLIFVPMVLLLFQNHAIADCPQGWTSESKTFTYEECEYTVYFCYDYSPQGILSIIIDKILTDTDEACIDYLGTVAFWSALNDDLIEHIVTKYQFPPCPLSVWNVQRESATCYYIENDPLNNVVWLKSCEESGTCIHYYKVCYNFSTQQVDIDYYDSDSDGGENCDDEMPDLSNENWELSWTTDCFLLPCFP